MRFLIVLALLKYAATYSVIDPANHKTVSVPIGNGMNVDVDVTVDINTGGNKPCIQKGDRCSLKEGEHNCCGWPEIYCKVEWPEHEGTCEKEEKRGNEQCKDVGEYCDPELPDPGDCCNGMFCAWDVWSRGDVCFKKNPQCIPVGGECSDSKPCCKPLWCNIDDIGTWTGTCGTKNKCNANEGEYCTKDEDCCEKDNACESETGSTRPTCTYKPKDCIEDGEPCHGTDDWTHECCSKSCCEGKCGTCGYTPWYKRS